MSDSIEIIFLSLFVSTCKCMLVSWKLSQEPSINSLVEVLVVI